MKITIQSVHVLFLAVAISSACSRAGEQQRPTGGQALAAHRSVCMSDAAIAGPGDALLRAARVEATVRPDAVDGWLAAGRGWVRKARNTSDSRLYLKVQSCAEVALAISPDSAPALELSALVMMDQHHFSAARDLATRVLADQPQRVIALGTLSDAELELGNFEPAREAVARLMDVLPSTAAYSRAAYLSWLRGDTDAAKIAMRHALMMARDRKDPEPAAWLFTEAGMIYWHQGDYEGAEAVFAKGLEWVPNYAPGLVGQARVALSEERYQRAESLLAQANDARPSAETAWLLADARAMLGDRAGAEQAHAKVKELGRYDRLTLARYLSHPDRDPDRAVELMQQERKSRGGPYIDDAHAWALFNAGDYDNARKFSDAALRLGTPDARLWYHAGAIRLAQGDSDGGLDLIRRALELNRAFDSRESAAARATLRSHGVIIAAVVARSGESR